MGDGYGKLLILLLAITLILLAMTQKGRQIVGVLTGAVTSSPGQTIPSPNPTDLGKTDLKGNSNIG